MAFENVNVYSLRSSINTCLGSLNKSASEELLVKLSDGNVWNAASRENLKRAIEVMVNERYKDLETTLQSYLNVTNLIEEYQSTEQEIARMEQQSSQLKPRLYRTETYPVTTTDSSGAVTTTTETRTVKDYSVESQLLDLDRRITENKSKMERLKNQVAAAI